MTLLVLLLLDGGIILIVSGIQGVPILSTIQQIWNDQLTFTPATTGDAGSPGGLSASQRGGVPFSAPTAPASGGLVPLSMTVLGSAAGPAQYTQQYDAYRQAMVRAYLQSQR